VKIGSAVWPRKSKNFGSQKIKNLARVIFHPYARTPRTEAITSNFSMRGDVADLATQAKFCVNRFREFLVLTPPILPFSVGLAGRPYNSVNNTVLYTVNTKL